MMNLLFHLAMQHMNISLQKLKNNRAAKVPIYVTNSKG